MTPPPKQAPCCHTVPQELARPPEVSLKGEQAPNLSEGHGTTRSQQEECSSAVEEPAWVSRLGTVGAWLRSPPTLPAEECSPRETPLLFPAASESIPLALDALLLGTIRVPESSEHHWLLLLDIPAEFQGRAGCLTWVSTKLLDVGCTPRSSVGATLSAHPHSGLSLALEFDRVGGAVRVFIVLPLTVLSEGAAGISHSSV